MPKPGTSLLRVAPGTRWQGHLLGCGARHAWAAATRPLGAGVKEAACGRRARLRPPAQPRGGGAGGAAPARASLQGWQRGAAGAEAGSALCWRY